MLMEFNYSYDIASLFIFITILLLNSQQNFYKNRSYYCYNIMLIVASVVPIADILSVETMKREMVFLYHFSNTIYYLGQQIVAFAFCSYVYAPLYQKKKVSFLKKFLYYLPLIIIFIIILSNPLTSWLYKYDFETRVYTYGKMQFLCYVVSLFYFVSALFWCNKRKVLYNKHIRFAFMNSAVIVAVFLIYALYKPFLLTKGFAFAMVLLQMFIIIMNEHPRKSMISGLLSKEFFLERIKILNYTKDIYHVICIKVTDYEMLLDAYGLNNIRKLEAEICNRLKDYVPNDCGYKIGEDIIALLIENQTDEIVKVFEQSIDSLLRQKWAVNGMDISFSYAIVTFTANVEFETDEELYNLIVHVQKDSKLSQGIVQLNDLEINKIKREHDVEVAIKEAFTNNEFKMYYQPIYSCEKKKFTSAEALIRLNHFELGYIGPMEFIPVAEKIGLIIPLGYWILEDVFKFVSNNDIEIYGLEYIEVNLSTVQCLQRDLLTTVFKLKDKYDINPKNICFEIGEITGTSAPETLILNIGALKEAGFRLAIDNFGTENSNLERIFTTEFDIVKYDKVTTDKLCQDNKLRSITGRISTMLHSMRCEIVAEGVETEEQYEHLNLMGVDHIQGFYFSPPLLADELIDFVRKRN